MVPIRKRSCDRSSPLFWESHARGPKLKRCTSSLCAAAIGGSRVSYSFPFLPNSGTLAGAVIRTIRRPVAVLGTVKWFGRPSVRLYLAI
jgi:hypothetical protein